MSQERSAEFCLGALCVAENNRLTATAGYYRKELAAAEAREASQPSAAEVIAAAEATLTAIVSRCVPLGEDSGDSGTVIIAESGLSAIARWKEANGG